MRIATALFIVPALIALIAGAKPSVIGTNQEELNQQIISSAMSLLTLGKQAGDVDVVRAFLWADNDPDRKVADAQARRMIANYALYHATVEKFGDGTAAKMIDEFHLSTPDGIMLSSVSWKINGDKATPSDDGMGNFDVTLHNVKGIWKIDVTGVSRSPKVIMLEAGVVDSIAKNVEAGKYHNVKDVANALLKAGVRKG